MSVSLSIKDVPDELAVRLRARAGRNHRSLQRELMAIIEAATAEPALAYPAFVAAPAAPAYAVASRPAAARHTPHAAGGMPPPEKACADELLGELDAIVANSRWGQAPVLSREQAHDRRLQRELDYDARRAQAGATRP